MQHEISTFDVLGASDEVLMEYAELSKEAFRIDRPDALVSPPEMLIKQLQSPHPSMGDQHVVVARVESRIEALALVHLFREPYETTAHLELRTRPSSRRRGLGTALLRNVLPILGAHDRKTVICYGVTADGDGDHWAKHTGFQETERVVMSALELGTSSSEVPTGSKIGYALVDWDDRAPDDLIAEYARARGFVYDTSQSADETLQPAWTAERIRDEEADLAAAGVRIHVVVALHQKSGEIRALTIVHRLPARADLATQLDTAVDRKYRGMGLARLVKAHMIEKLRSEHPLISQLRTNVAATNEAMLAVNRRAGFKPVRAMITVTGETEDIRRRFVAP